MSQSFGDPETRFDHIAQLLSHMATLSQGEQSYGGGNTSSTSLYNISAHQAQRQLRGMYQTAMKLRVPSRLQTI